LNTKGFGQTYEGYEKEWEQIFEKKTSELAYEEEVESTSFGLGTIKQEGASFQYDTHQQLGVQRFTHATWGLGYIVTMEELADNQYKSKSFKRAKMLAFSLHQTKEVNCANVLNFGFTTSQPSGFASADGVALFSASHPTPAGNQSNIVANAADLFEASLEDIVVQISLAQNNRGLIFANRPKKLIVHPSNGFNAERILHSPLQNDTANNAVNALRRTGVVSEGYVVNHFLSNPVSWFVQTHLDDGLTVFQRQELQFEQDNDSDTKNAKAKSWERYSVGWSEFRAQYASLGT
jgi:hypothetical protein